MNKNSSGEAIYRCTLDHHDFEDFFPVVVVPREGPRGAAVLFAKALCADEPDWYSYFEVGGNVRVLSPDGRTITRCVVSCSRDPRFAVVRSEEEA